MTPSDPRTPTAPETIGRYRVLRKLGEGGMGVVYAARDERLDRDVAIKTIRDDTTSESRERIWREARAAASVNHPNVCQLYEIGEDEGSVFIAMEMLEGESLADRIARSPLPLTEAVQTTIAMLSALEAIHRRGIVHRDLKPSNVHLTPHGVKLLDFGLARATRATEQDLTMPGTVVGTPRYMTPEQWSGGAVDQRTDLFTVGALLHEMLTGRPAFEGELLLEICRAVANDQPPVLTGSPAIVAVDRAIHRALAKKPDARYATADGMADDLRAALLLIETGETAAVRPMTRLIVLPFRALRPDPDTDFLAISLPDAITSSLSGVESLVVRSSLAASRFVGESLDLRKIAAEADVDVVLSGTLLRSGEQLRVSTQLVEAPAGTVVWSKTSQVALGDIFELQDSLAKQIVDSLALPLSGRERGTLESNVPVNPKAYELYLRANALGPRPSSLHEARDLYSRCLEADPRYAPAWARIGRVYRLIAKLLHEEPAENLVRSEDAFRRALEINPDLSMAHNLYAQLEVDLGRAKEAMVRLIARAEGRQGDPELFAGLVHACRYCNLLEASVAAYERAHRLDPAVRTSVAWSYWMLEDYAHVIETDDMEFRFVQVMAYLAMGHRAEAVKITDEIARDAGQGTISHFVEATRAVADGRLDDAVVAVDRITESSFRDPEGIYFAARFYAHAGESEKAMATLRRVIDEGFHCVAVMTRDPWLDPLRAEPEFTRLLRAADAKAREAAAAYVAAGGDRVLGVPAR